MFSALEAVLLVANLPKKLQKRLYAQSFLESQDTKEDLQKLSQSKRLDRLRTEKPLTNPSSVVDTKESNE